MQQGTAHEQKEAMPPPPPKRETGMPPPPKKTQQQSNNGSAGAPGTEQQGKQDTAKSMMPPPPPKKADTKPAPSADVPGDQQPKEKAAAGTEKQQNQEQHAAPAPAHPAYTPPPWAGVPEGVPYRLEVLKSGTIVEAKDLNQKDHYTFGRTPGCDFVLEHPSASRLHAVLQFHRDSKAAYIFDNASTHGTFVNKQRVKPHVHVPIRVGDTIKFGQSSRLYLFFGPEELLPEEGLTKSQKAQLAQLEYAERMKELDKKQSAAAMEAALSSGATWGMQEDAVEDPEEGVVNVDWRAMWTANKLTEKQQKQAEKIRQKEHKIKNLQAEVDKILAKEKVEAGLTPGQTATLARNEQAMAALQDEVEDLEEALVESVRDAVTDRNKDKIQAAKSTARRRKRGTTASDEEYLEGTDSDDDFYDRTTSGRAAAGTKKARTAATAEKEKPQVESAQSLYGKREVLRETIQNLTDEVAREERALASQAKGQPQPMDTDAPMTSTEAPASEQSTQQPPSSAPVPATDQPSTASHQPPSSTPVDAPEGMNDLQKHAGSAQGGAHRSGGTQGGLPTHSHTQHDGQGDTTGHGTEQQGEQQQGGTGQGGGKQARAHAPAAVDDSLDAFMSSIAVQQDDEKLKRLKESLEDAKVQLARTERLLKIADPDGWLQPSSKAAQAAKQAAQEAIEAERKRCEAAAAEAARKKKEAEAASVVEEEEDDDVQLSTSASGACQGPAPSKPAVLTQNKPVVLKANPKATPKSQYNPHRLEAEAPEQWGLQVRKPPGGTAIAAASAQGKAGGAPRNPEAAAAAAKMIAEFSGGATDRERAASSKSKGSKSTGAANMQCMAAENKAKEEAAARVAADLEVLGSADRRKRELEELAAQEREEAEAAAQFVASREAAAKAKEEQLRQRLGGY